MEKNLQIYLTINGIDNYSKPIEQATKSTTEFTAVHNKNAITRESNNTKEQHGVSTLSKAYSTLSKVAISFASASGLKKAFQEFAYQDKYIKKTQGLLHSTNTEMQSYANNIKNIAANSLNSINDLLEVGFIGAKSGFKAEQLSEFVNQVDMIQTAVSTSTSETAQSVAENFGIIAKSFNKQPIAILADEYARLIDTTQNLNLHEMGMGLQKLNMVANSTGASFRSLSPAVASLIAVGMSGARASTQIFGIAKAFEKFGNKRVAQMLGLKEASLQGDGFIKLLNDMNGKFGNMQEMQRNKVLSKIFGAETAITIGQLLKQMDSINQKVNDLKTNAEGFNKHMSDIQKEGAFGSLKKISAQFSLVFSELGEAIANSGIPDIILMLMKFVTKITQGFGYFGKFISAAKSVGSIGLEIGKIKFQEVTNPNFNIENVKKNNLESLKKEIENIQVKLNLPSLMQQQQTLTTNQSTQNDVNVVITNKSPMPMKVEKIENNTKNKPTLIKHNILNR